MKWWVTKSGQVRLHDRRMRLSPICKEALPLLIAGLGYVGHYQTRSRGTLCGSVAHADPSAETALCLATLGGDVELTSARGVRRMPVDDFILGALTTSRKATR